MILIKKKKIIGIFSKISKLSSNINSPLLCTLNFKQEHILNSKFPRTCDDRQCLRVAKPLSQQSFQQHLAHGWVLEADYDGSGVCLPTLASHLLSSVLIETSSFILVVLLGFYHEAPYPVPQIRLGL